jgi:hypothetical protein
MSLHLRHGAVEERGAAPGQTFWVVCEDTDRNTDNMACESKESKNDEVEVVETVGCGGPIRALFNPRPGHRPDGVNRRARRGVAPR